MRRYSIFHVPVMSFFSRELYKDVGLNWKGTNFLYLFLLLAVCWIPAMIELHVGFTGFVNNYAPTVIEQVPEITINKGQVSIEETQPYYIIEPGSGADLVIIDTTGQVESLDEQEAFCLLTDNKLMTKKQYEQKTYDLSKIEHFVLDSERITGWLEVIRKVLAVALYPFALFGSYVYRIVQALIYASIGLLFASFCKTKLSYAALIRLAVVAVTPCIIVSTILGLGCRSIPAYIYPTAVLVYLFFAIRSIRTVPQVHADEDHVTGNQEAVPDENRDQ